MNQVDVNSRIVSFVYDFARRRYFSEEYSTTALYWSSLCDLMGENDGSTQAVKFPADLFVDAGDCLFIPPHAVQIVAGARIILWSSGIV